MVRLRYDECRVVDEVTVVSLADSSFDISNRRPTKRHLVTYTICQHHFGANNIVITVQHCLPVSDVASRQHISVLLSTKSKTKTKTSSTKIN